MATSRHLVIAGALRVLGLRSPASAATPTEPYRDLSGSYDADISRLFGRYEWQWASRSVALLPVLDADGERVRSNRPYDRNKAATSTLIIYQVPPTAERIAEIWHSRLRESDPRVWHIRDSEGIHAEASDKLLCRIIERKEEALWPEFFERCAYHQLADQWARVHRQDHTAEVQQLALLEFNRATKEDRRNSTYPKLGDAANAALTGFYPLDELYPRGRHG